MTTRHQDRPLGNVIVDPATEPYWAAAREGVLKLRRCTACRKAHWYPRPVCPFCQGDTEWEEARGTGEIYSLSVTRRAGPEREPPVAESGPVVSVGVGSGVESLDGPRSAHADRQRALRRDRDHQFAIHQ